MSGQPARVLNEAARGRRVIYTIAAMFLALFAGTFLLAFLVRSSVVFILLAAAAGVAVFVRVVKVIRRYTR